MSIVDRLSKSIQVFGIRFCDWWKENMSVFTPSPPGGLLLVPLLLLLAPLSFGHSGELA